MALNRPQRAMLDRIVKRGGPMDELLITGSGGRSYYHLQHLIREGLVRRLEHPTIKDRRTGYGVDAVEATEAGRMF